MKISKIDFFDKKIDFGGILIDLSGITVPKKCIEPEKN
jgi:hypothetical protein